MNKKNKVDPKESIRKVLHLLDIRNQSLLVAVSGGADSVALLVLLNELKIELKLELHVGHFDHQLRSESCTDAEWVRSLCERMGINCVLGTPSENDEIRTTGIEESARRKRYDFLKSAAEKLNCRWIAVAHTEDDQVETVLHHIARGTGLRGLQGIPEVRELSPAVCLLRPLLKVRREQLLEKLSSEGQAYRTDETNVDSAFTRNRIRHEVLPFLKTSLNPQIDQALIRLSVQAQEAQNAIEEIASLVLSESIKGMAADSVVRINVESLQTQPRAIVIAAMMLLWEQQKWPRQKMSQHHWSQLAEMISENKTGAGLSCPGGVQVSLRRNVLEFRQIPKSD